MSRFTVVVLGVLVVAGTGWRLAESRQTTVPPTGSPATSADARQQQILRDDLGHPTDAALARRYADLNTRYFSNALPATPVVWEPRLEEVGKLAGRSFTLLGVFGQSGDKTIILLHPSLRDDDKALDRALCHEMVHAYLFTLGDATTDHGEAFQSVLRRLSNEGAFVGLPASPEERAQLRAWLDKETMRLQVERRALSEMHQELDHDRGEVEHSGQGAQGYNERVDALNHRVLDLRLAEEEFNRQVSRYKLMTTYPDGLDEK